MLFCAHHLQTRIGPRNYLKNIPRKILIYNQLLAYEFKKTCTGRIDSHNTKTKSRSFEVGNTLWLHSPTPGKLDAKWEGGWIVKYVLSPTSIRIEHSSTRRTMVVHINRLQHRRTSA